MPNDDTPSHAHMTHATNGGVPATQSGQQHRFFHIPAPLKRVFDRYPLVTYDENERPLRAPRETEEHVLHVFTTTENAKRGKPSFNPGCLKWQAYLRFSGLTFRTVPSSNHASPTGILPFLVIAAAGSADAKTQDAVPGSKLRKFAKSAAPKLVEEPKDIRYEAYTSLLDTAVRRAWLYQLYINPANANVVHELYVAPCSSNRFVQMTIAYQLRHAATDELAKSAFSGAVVEEDIFHDAEDAISSLSELLGSDQWFFGQSQPSILDASVFAFTHLILDGSLQWHRNKLAELVNQYQNLRDHQGRILNQYF